MRTFLERLAIILLFGSLAVSLVEGTKLWESWVVILACSPIGLALFLLVIVKLILPQKPRWIPFRDLVSPNDDFKPCPNCGDESVATQVFGGLLPMVCDPECMSCGHRFRPQRNCFFLKGFNVMSPEAYKTMLDQLDQKRRRRDLRRAHLNRA